MPKRRVEEEEGYHYQSQRRNGDLACKRPRPDPARRRRKHKHLYLVLDDWDKGYSIHKIDLASFESDSDDDDHHRDSSTTSAVAGHLLALDDPPVLRLESPGPVRMDFAAMGNKIFIVTDARYGHTPALIYDTETAALALGPATPAGHRQRGGLISDVMAVHGRFYAFFSHPACNGHHRSVDDEDQQQHSFDVMTCTPTRRGPAADGGWFWRSLPASSSSPPPFNVDDEFISSYAVHSDGHTIYMTTSYRGRPGIQKSTYSFSTRYHVWRRHSWALPFSDQGYFIKLSLPGIQVL